MFCEKCGTRIEDGDVFCSNCGEPVVQAAPAQPEVPVTPVAPITPPPAAPQPAPVVPAPAYTIPLQAKPAKKKKKPIPIILVIVIIAAAIVGGVIFYMRGRLTAAAMKLVYSNGEVVLKDNEGYELELEDGLKLHDGDSMNTGSEGLAYIALDEDRFVTLMSESAADFVKKGKKLKLDLTEGRLFFNIDRALEEDERLNIRTSTMIIGIRGTSGYINTDEHGNEALYMTSGTVAVRATDENAEEVKATAGEKVTSYIGPDGNIVFVVEEFPLTALPQEAAYEILADEILLREVEDATGWTQEEIEERNDTASLGYYEGSDYGAPAEPYGSDNSGSDPVEDDNGGDDSDDDGREYDPKHIEYAEWTGADYDYYSAWNGEYKQTGDSSGVTGDKASFYVSAPVEGDFWGSGVAATAGTFKLWGYQNGMGKMDTRSEGYFYTHFDPAANNPVGAIVHPYQNDDGSYAIEVEYPIGSGNYYYFKKEN